MACRRKNPRIVRRLKRKGDLFFDRFAPCQPKPVLIYGGCGYCARREGRAQYAFAACLPRQAGVLRYCRRAGNTRNLRGYRQSRYAALLMPTAEQTHPVGRHAAGTKLKKIVLQNQRFAKKIEKKPSHFFFDPIISDEGHRRRFGFHSGASFCLRFGRV